MYICLQKNCCTEINYSNNKFSSTIIDYLKKNKFPSDKVHLMHKGQVIKIKNSSLNDYDINNNDIIKVILPTNYIQLEDTDIQISYSKIKK